MSKRGNGQGSVYKTSRGTYRAVITLGYYVDDSGKMHRRTRSVTTKLKKDAVNALTTLRESPKARQSVSFRDLYQKWFPTHRASKSTLDCYRAAFKWFSDIQFMKIDDIDIDDLQECLDSCPHGKRTRENMKSLVGLMYKFGIPRDLIPNDRNLGQFLIVNGESSARRDSFSEDQIQLIKKSVGRVPYADYIYAMIYMGFRPTEFLQLDCSQYDELRHCFVAGSKTTAGINRTVTVSPKILSIVEDQIAGRHTGTVFYGADGNEMSLKKFTEDCFYPALESIGIENPLVEIAGGAIRHKFTPHSCRHTFATLLKRVAGSDKDKMELIGHSSPEMVRYYQDVSIEDIQRLTDAI